MKNTAHQEDFVIKRLNSGGVITNYFCTSSCGHCLYFCSPKWKKDYIEKGMLVQIIEKIRSLGCCSIHIGGGEPFLDLSGLKMVVETCKSTNMGIEYVETNSSWYNGINSALKSGAIWSWRKALRPKNFNHVAFMRKTDTRYYQLWLRKKNGNAVFHSITANVDLIEPCSIWGRC